MYCCVVNTMTCSVKCLRGTRTSCMHALHLLNGWHVWTADSAATCRCAFSRGRLAFEIWVKSSAAGIRHCYSVISSGRYTPPALLASLKYAYSPCVLSSLLTCVLAVDFFFPPSVPSLICLPWFFSDAWFFSVSSRRPRWLDRFPHAY